MRTGHQGRRSEEQDRRIPELKKQKKKRSWKRKQYIQTRKRPILTALSTARTGALLIYRDALGSRLFRSRRIHSLLYVRSQAIESLLDVDVVLGRHLEKRNA